MNTNRFKLNKDKISKIRFPWKLIAILLVILGIGLILFLLSDSVKNIVLDLLAALIETFVLSNLFVFNLFVIGIILVLIVIALLIYRKL